MEDHSSSGGKRFLSQACLPQAGCVYGKDKAVLREVLSGGYLQEKRSFIKKKKEEAENEKFEIKR